MVFAPPSNILTRTFLTFVNVVPSRSWTSSEQVTFLRAYEAEYLKASQSKKINAFFAGFFPKWFEKFPEQDASGDATDVEENSLSQNARKHLAKEEQAAKARRAIIDAQAGLSV